LKETRWDKKFENGMTTILKIHACYTNVDCNNSSFDSFISNFIFHAMMMPKGEKKEVVSGHNKKKYRV